MNYDLDIYISFWGFKDFDVENLNSDMEFIVHMMSCSYFFASLNYKNVYLVTDTKSKTMFEHIPFTAIFTELDVLFELDNKYHRYWSLGKIKTMEFAASKGRPFVQIDYDVFIKKPLPEWLTSADLFCQSPEPVDLFPYNLDVFYSNYNYLGYAETRSLSAYNCGIFGVNNLNFIKKFSKSVFTFIKHPQNDWVFDTEYERIVYGGSNDILDSSNPAKLAGFQCAIWAEQYYLACAAAQEKIEVKLLFEGYDNVTNSNLAQSYGYVHLMEGKNDPIRIQQISNFAKRLYEHNFDYKKIIG